MAKGALIQNHLDDFNSIIIDLQSIDVKIEDEDKTISLVVSLPSSYKHFKKILLYGDNEALSFEDIKASLLSKEKFDLEFCSINKGDGLNVRGRPFGKEGITRRSYHSKSKRSKFNKFGKYCKK